MGAWGDVGLRDAARERGGNREGSGAVYGSSVAPSLSPYGGAASKLKAPDCGVGDLSNCLYLRISSPGKVAWSQFAQRVRCRHLYGLLDLLSSVFGL